MLKLVYVETTARGIVALKIFAKKWYKPVLINIEATFALHATWEIYNIFSCHYIVVFDG